MKYLAVAILLLFATAARADSFVQVDYAPTVFDVAGFNPSWGSQETIAVSFLWDTTTSVLSDFKVTVEGALPLGNSAPFYLVSGGQLNFLSLFDGQWQTGNIDHVEIEPILTDDPGVQRTDLFLGAPTGNTLDFMGGTATVTTVDPTKTPEPGTVALLGMGLLALFACGIFANDGIATHYARPSVRLRRIM